MTGTKVAEGEDVSRVAGTESQELLQQDVNATTSFSTAAVLLAGLTATSQAIPATAGAGVLRLTQNQVGLVKLMVLNDSLANTMVRYQDMVGQAQEKNLQRFFPKSRRDEYVKTIAQANLDAAELAALRAEIWRTAAADAQLLFNSADPSALRTDEAFTEMAQIYALNHPVMTSLQNAKLQNTDPTRGLPLTPLDLLNIKTAVLGNNGALLENWILLVSYAYTEDIGGGDAHYFHDPNKANPTAQDVTDFGANNGGWVSTVMVTSRGFTPLGGERGAIYEMREREIAIDKSGYFNIGSLKEMNNAIDLIFGAVE